ncbi:MAG: acetate uptake transporter [Treponema sp.]|nr:acetate uptake transporter [Treponema sp.]
MSVSSSEKKTVNPGPLGLLGFGMTTVLLNLNHTGIIELSIVIVAMGIALGGIAQIVAGISALRIGDTFGGTAFTAYGLFWWSLCIIWINPFGAVISPADSVSLGFYLALWGVFTFFMFLGTILHNTVTKIVFLSLSVLFFLLSAGAFSGNPFITTIAGYVGIFCGLSAIYSAMAQVVNGEFGKTIFPT